MGIITLILGMTIAVTITLCIVLFLLFQPHLKQHGYLRTPKTKSKHKKKGRNAPKTPLNTPGRPSPERQSSFDVPTTSPIASAEPKSDLPTRKPSSSATSNEIDSSIATLQQSLTDDLRIRPGENRCALLLSLIWDVYFATSPNRLLPLDPQAFTPANLAQLSHEAAALFLSRHGAHLWPPAPQPAPHLLDRTLAYPRDATLTAAKRAEYVSLGLREPAVNSGIDIAYSPLGERLARYVSRVFTCPLRKRGPVAWGAVALVLDEWGLEGREVVGERLELLGGALRREVGRG